MRRVTMGGCKVQVGEAGAASWMRRAGTNFSLDALPGGVSGDPPVVAHLFLGGDAAVNFATCTNHHHLFLFASPSPAHETDHGVRGRIFMTTMIVSSISATSHLHCLLSLHDDFAFSLQNRCDRRSLLRVIITCLLSDKDPASTLPSAPSVEINC